MYYLFLFYFIFIHLFLFFTELHVAIDSFGKFWAFSDVTENHHCNRSSSQKHCVCFNKLIIELLVMYATDFT